MTPAELISARRKRAGLSQAELARRMDTSQSAIARLEGGETDPRWSTIERALKAVGEQASLSSAERKPPAVDEEQILAYLRLSPAQRLEVFQKEYDRTRRALLNAR